MNPDATVLVLVGGAPGSGKTTLARRLSDELGLPLLSRDGLKEVLLDVLGAHDRATAEPLGKASHALLYSLLDCLVGKAPGLIAENNFPRGRAEPELLPFVERSRAVLLHCGTTTSEVERRIAARSGAIDRHPGHLDLANLPGVLERIAAGEFDPLDLPVPVLRIDTTDGYEPPVRDVVQFVRQARRRPRFPNDF